MYTCLFLPHILSLISHFDHRSFLDTHLFFPHLIRQLICGFPKLKARSAWLVIWEGPNIGIGIGMQNAGADAARSIMWKPMLHAILTAAAKRSPYLAIHVSIYDQSCACQAHYAVHWVQRSLQVYISDESKPHNNETVYLSTSQACATAAKSNLCRLERLVVEQLELHVTQMRQARLYSA
jgi:hypothetical protein